jgi:hypothetical protein
MLAEHATTFYKLESQPPEYSLFTLRDVEDTYLPKCTKRAWNIKVQHGKTSHLISAFTTGDRR